MTARISVRIDLGPPCGIDYIDRHKDVIWITDRIDLILDNGNDSPWVGIYKAHTIYTIDPEKENYYHT